MSGPVRSCALNGRTRFTTHAHWLTCGWCWKPIIMVYTGMTATVAAVNTNSGDRTALHPNVTPACREAGLIARRVHGRDAVTTCGAASKAISFNSDQPRRRRCRQVRDGVGNVAGLCCIAQRCPFDRCEPFLQNADGARHSACNILAIELRWMPVTKPHTLL
jgi:hypothetical protein